MRDIFWNTIYERMKQDGRIIIAMSDTGFGVLDQIRKDFPQRCYNVGIREQGGVGLCAGLCDAGLRPIFYAICPFTTLRPFEFIRDLIDIQAKPVCLVGIGGGLDYSTLGGTHHADIDLGAMRLLYGIDIFAPCDEEATKIIAETLPRETPTYIRLSRYSQSSLYPKEAGYLEAGVSKVKDGNDNGHVGVFSTGVILEEVLKAVEIVGEMIGDYSTVYDVYKFKPEPQLMPFLAEHQRIVTVEEHNITGGLGSMVAEMMAKGGEPYYKLSTIGIKGYIRVYDNKRENILKAAGLDKQSIADEIMRIYNF